MTSSPSSFMSDEPAHRWREPLPSVASRNLPEKPRLAARPVIVTTGDFREIECESDLEAKAAYVLMARPDCLRLEEQAKFIRYSNLDGEKQRHIFDFLLILRSGCRIAVAVKPLEVALKYDLEKRLRHMAPQLDPAFANGVLLLTEAKLTRTRVANAKLIHEARRDPDREADRKVTEAVGALHGATSIDCILKVASLEDHEQGFYSACRAIGNGMLEPIRHGLIDRHTLVRRGSIVAACGS